MASAIFTKAAEQWQDMKSDYLSYVDYTYLAAVAECAGVLVNKLGREHNVDGFTLFTGNRERAYNYASEELVAWWEKHPRLSMNQFEDQWVQGRLEFQ